MDNKLVSARVFALVVFAFILASGTAHAAGNPTISVSPASANIDASQSINLVASTGNLINPTFTWDAYLSNNFTPLPPGCYSKSSCNTANTQTVSLSALGGVSPGTYNIEVAATNATQDGAYTSYVHSYITINPDLVAGAPTPASPSIDSGQSITLTANPSGGTTPYTTYQWFSNKGSAPSCTSTYAISGATSNTYIASPTATTYYAYNVIDSSANAPESACSSGDVVTVDPVLTVSAPVLSNTTIDAGQSAMMSVNVGGGTPPYSVNFGGSDSSCFSGGAVNSNQGTLSSAGTFNQLFSTTTTDTFNFGGDTLANNPVSSVPCSIGVYAEAVDSAFSPATTSGSETNIQINKAPTVTISPSNQTLDSGQKEVYTAQISGGTGPFTVNLINVSTGSVVQTISGASAGSVKFTAFAPTAVGPHTYNVIATDTGTTTYDVFNSTANTINVNPALLLISFTVSNSVTDSGQYETLTATVSGGTPPYTYTFYNLTNGHSPIQDSCTGVTTNSVTESCTLPGPTKYTGEGGKIFTYNVVVSDSASTPNTVNSTGANVIVYPQYYVTATPQNALLDIGQTITFTVSEHGGFCGVNPSNSVCVLDYSWSVPPSLHILNNCASAGTQTNVTTCTIYTPNPSTTPITVTGTDTGVSTPYTASNTIPVTVNSLSVNVHPSSTKIDMGQGASFLANVLGGSAGAWTTTPPSPNPYSLQWSVDGAAQVGQTSKSFTFLSGSFALGKHDVTVDLSDTGTTPSANPQPVTTSAGANVTVYSDPTVTLTSPNTIMDVGQTGLFTAQISANGGVGPFTTNLVIVGSPGSLGSQSLSNGGSYTFSYAPLSTGSPVNFEAVANDTGTSPNYMFNSASLPITVNPKLSHGTESITGVTPPGCTSLPTCIVSSSKTSITIDQNEGAILTGTAPSGGTPPYSYQWLASYNGGAYSATDANTLCGASAQSTTCNFLTTTSNPIGPYTFVLSESDGATNPVTVNATPQLTVNLNSAMVLSPTTTNTPVIDFGQSLYASDIIPTTGTSPYSYQWWYSSDGGQFRFLDLYTSHCTSAADSVSGGISETCGVNSNATSPANSVGTYQFMLRITDSAALRPEANSLPVNILINPALTIAAPAASNSSVLIGQDSTLTDTGASGGTPSYSYQWFEEANGTASFTPISGATSLSYVFNTLGLTQAGNYIFKLQATDSASTPVSVNSSNVVVTVSPMFVTPRKVLSVSANVANSPDYGYNNYWALDTFTRDITAYQTGLTSFILYYKDSGTAGTYAGVGSPGINSISEPNNGVATLDGNMILNFNGTFTPGGNPVSGSIGTFDDGATIGNLYNGTNGTAVSSDRHFLNMYFTPIGASHYTGPSGSAGPSTYIWYLNYTYTYNPYPPTGQVFTEVYNTITNIYTVNGDIRTYLPPTVTVLPSSSQAIDYDQQIPINSTVTQGIGPFTYSWTANTVSGTCPAPSIASTKNSFVFNTLNYSSSSVSNCAFTFTATVVDTEANDPLVSNTFTFTGTSAPVTVNPAPVVSIVPPTANLDLAQAFNFASNVIGGTGSFTYQWAFGGITVPGQTAANYMFNTSIFPAPSAGPGQKLSISINDIGTSKLATYPEPKPSGTAFLNLFTTPAITLATTNTPIDLGQNVIYTATVTNAGVGPFTVNLVLQGVGVVGTKTVPIGGGSVSFVYQPVSTGSLVFNAVATDTGTTSPSYVFNSTSNTIIVNTALSAGAITPPSPIIDSGQSILLTANPSGGAGEYSYQWYAGPSATCASDATISGATSNTYTASPSSNTYYCYAVTDSSSTPVTTESATDQITVNPAPVVTITPNTVTIDQTQSVTFTAAVMGGTGPLFTYQWVNDTSGTPSNIPGATSNTFALLGVAHGRFKYYVLATDTGTASGAMPTITVSSNIAKVRIYVSPSVTIPSNSVLMDLGQSVMINSTTNGGTGLFSFNWLEEAPGASSFTPAANCGAPTSPECLLTTLAGNFGGSVNNSASYETHATVNVPLSGGASLYICAGGDGNGALTSQSWSVDSSDQFTGSYSTPSYPVSSVGHQSGSTCTASSHYSDLAVAGIGINLNSGFGSGSYTLTQSNSGTNNAISGALNYNVASNSSFTVIAVACGWYNCTSVTVPTGCTPVEFVNGADTYETAFIAVCQSQNAGSYTVNDVLSSNGGTSMAAYVFAPGAVSSSTVTPIQAGTYNLKVEITDFGTGVSDPSLIRGSHSYNAGDPISSNAVSPATVSNVANIESITIDSAPSVLVSPSPAVVDKGQSITFTASPSGGTGSYNYQWFNDTSGTGIAVSGAVSNTLTVKGAKTGNFLYYVVINDTGTSGPEGGVNPNATAQSTNVRLAVDTAPSVSVTPLSTAMDHGQSITLTANPSGGTGSYSYQWYSDTNSTAIAGATSNTYVVNGGATGTFAYYVKVTDAGTTLGSTPAITATSSDASVTVESALGTLTITPSSATIDNTQYINLAANENGGTGNYSYQWQLNGNNFGTDSNTVTFYGNASTLASSIDHVTVTATDIGTLSSPTPSTSFALSSYDNDFLWTAANEYYAPAAPFGTWSATPEGCYNQPVPGTGICATIPNGYSNLGGSVDLGTISVKGNVMVATNFLSGTSLEFYNNGSAWIQQPVAIALTVNGLPQTFYQKAVLNFGGNTPSQANFVNGTLAEWIYVNLPQSDASTVLAQFPDAVFDTNTNAWLVGFNINLMENKCYPSCTQPASYFSTPFPSSGNTLTQEPLPLSSSATFALTANGVTSNLVVPGTVPSVIELYPTPTQSETSSPSLITVDTVPQVSITPQNSLIDHGQTIKLTAFASGGTGTFTYQWVNDTSGTPSNIPGATSNTFTFNGVNTGNFVYYVSATDAGTSASALPTITVQSSNAKVTVDPAPSVAINPSSSSVDIGQTMTLTSTTSGGSGSFTYQWYNDTSNTPVAMPGATSSTLSIFANSLGNYIYTAQITDTGLTSGATPTPEQAMSNNAAVTIYNAPVVSVSPSPVLIDQDQHIQLAANVLYGTGSFAYQWVNDTSGTPSNIPGATSSTYTFNAANMGNFIYYAQVHDTGTPLPPTAVPPVVANSPDVPITVLSNPATKLIMLKPGIDVGQLDNATANVTGGTGDFNYNWRYSGFIAFPLKGCTSYPANDNMCSLYPVLPGNYAVNVFVTDVGVTPGALPTIVSDAGNSFAVSTNPLLVSVTPPNITVSAGTTVMFTANIVGGSAPYSYDWSYSPSTGNNIVQGCVTTNSFSTSNACNILISSNGVYTVKVNIADNTGQSVLGISTIDPPGTSTPTPLSIAAPTSASASITQGQSTTINDIGASGGTYPYSYQWLEEAPGATSYSSATDCGAGNSASFNTVALCTFTTSSSTAAGTYGFELQVADSQSVIATSNAISITLSAPVSTPTGSGGGGGGGGGSGGGGSGGGGGNFVPTVSSVNGGSCTQISNFSAKNQEYFKLYNTTFHVTDNFITPNSTGVTVNNANYTLLLDRSVSLGTSNGFNYTIELMNLSYIPIAKTVTVDICVTNPPKKQTPPVNLPPSNTVTPGSNTTVVTTTVRQSTTRTITNSSSSGAGVNSNGAYYTQFELPIGLGLLALIILAGLLATRKKGKGSRRKR